MSRLLDYDYAGSLNEAFCSVKRIFMTILKILCLVKLILGRGPLAFIKILLKIFE